VEERGRGRKERGERDYGQKRESKHRICGNGKNDETGMNGRLGKMMRPE